MHYCSMFLQFVHRGVQTSAKIVLVVQCRDAAQSFAFVLIHMAHLVALGCRFGVFHVSMPASTLNLAMILLNFPPLLLCPMSSLRSWLHEPRFVQKVLP